VVYYTKSVEDLKTRHQWRMLMKDVITCEVTVAANGADLHSVDPTAACVSIGGALSDGNERSSSASSSSSASGAGRRDSIGVGEGSVEEDEVVIVDHRDSEITLKEPLPPHKVVMRKRGDQEVKIELYGVWQTEPYTVRQCSILSPTFV
jgi:hypothetical protein